MTARANWIEYAREAVLHASVVCRAVQSRIGEVRAITKDDNSPVTTLPPKRSLRTCWRSALARSCWWGRSPAIS